MTTTSIVTKPRLGYYRNERGQLFEATKLHEDRSVTVRRTCTGKELRLSWALFHERFIWANETRNNRPIPTPAADDPKGSMAVVVYFLVAFIAVLCGLLIWCGMKVEW